MAESTTYNGKLPPLIQGEVFTFVVGPTEDPVTDFTSTDVTLYFDPPAGVTASRLTLSVGSGGTVGGGGTYVSFEKNQAWTAALAAGDWDLRVCLGANTAPDQVACYILPVEAPRKGALS